MEYNNENNKLIDKDIDKKNFLQNYLLAFILILLFTVFLIIFNFSFNKNLEYNPSTPKKKEYSINETEVTDLIIIKPNKYKEKISHFQLSNGVEIILMNPPKHNKKTTKDSIGLIVGSGAMNDDKIEGLAHFTEHMLFLGSKKYSNETFFNELITSNEGHFNGFTDKDTTTFIYEIKPDKFLESLDVFLNFFVRPLFKADHVEKEIFAVNSEFEKNIHSDEKRFDRLFQLMSNPAHPLHKFSTGNKDTLKADGITNHLLREKVSKYFHKHYIGKNIKIIAYTNHELENLKKILLNNMVKIHNTNNLSVKEKFLQRMKHKNNGEDIQMYTPEQKGKIIFYKSRYKTLKIFFFMKDFKFDLEKNPKMFFKILFSMKYKNSLADNLIKQRLIFNFNVDFKDKYKDLSAICFKFLLTENGLKNSDMIIKMLSQFIHITHDNISDRKLFEYIKEINNKKFLDKKKIHNGYTKMKKLTKNFFLFGKKNFITGDNLIKEYNHSILHDFVKNMTLANAQIYIGSRTFKNYNKTYLYKILNNQDEEKEILYKKENEKNENLFVNSSVPIKNNKLNYSEHEFLDEKEKWYKTKYKTFKLDDDHLWHILKRGSNMTFLEYPDFYFQKENKKILKKTSLCKDEETNEKIKKKDCRKLFSADKKNSLPEFIHKNNFTEIYLKQDRLHLDKSFILNIKLIPDRKIFNLENNKNVVMIKFLTIYLNFMYEEIKIKNNNFYDYQTEVNFKDNHMKKIPLFKWRNSKERLIPEDYSIDGVYMTIKSKSSEIFEKTEIFKNLRKILKEKIKKNDFTYLKEELYRYIEFYKSSNPTHQAFNWLYRLGFKHDIDYFNMTHIIKKIKIKEFNQFISDVFNGQGSNMKILILGVGTINEEKLIEYSEEIEKSFLKRNYIKETLEIVKKDQEENDLNKKIEENNSKVKRNKKEKESKKSKIFF